MLSTMFVDLNKYSKVFNEITRQGTLISYLFYMFNTSASKNSVDWLRNLPR